MPRCSRRPSRAGRRRRPRAPGRRATGRRPVSASTCATATAAASCSSRTTAAASSRVVSGPGADQPAGGAAGEIPVDHRGGAAHRLTVRRREPARPSGSAAPAAASSSATSSRAPSAAACCRRASAEDREGEQPAVDGDDRPRERVHAEQGAGLRPDRAGRSGSASPAVGERAVVAGHRQAGEQAGGVAEAPVGGGPDDPREDGGGDPARAWFVTPGDLPAPRGARGRGAGRDPARGPLQVPPHRHRGRYEPISQRWLSAPPEKAGADMRITLTSVFVDDQHEGRAVLHRRPWAS